jgi:diguanylate cyclase (GGDEF)-like protein/PAS domain S-box-containing protein
MTADIRAHQQQAGAGTSVLTYTERIAALEETIDEVFEGVPFGAHSVAADGTYARINSVELAWLGCTRNEVIGKKRPADFLTAASMERALRNTGRQGHHELVDQELELVGKNGEPRLISVTSNWFEDGNGIIQGHRAISFDLTEDKRRREQQRVAALAFDTLAGMCVTDANGHVLQVNRAFSALTGYTLDDVRGKTMHVLSSGKHGPDFYREMWSSIQRTGMWQGEIYNRRKDGMVIAEWLSIAAIHAPQGGVLHYVGTFFDITTSKANQAEISHLAFYDPLTLLPNRRLLQDRLAHALKIAPRTGLHGALLYIDLDNFKTINDTRGHAAGDRVLVEVARRLKACVRGGDTVARIGGDEFVVLLDGLHPDSGESAVQASDVGQKILVNLAQVYEFGDFEFECSGSIGVSMFSAGDIAEDLLQHADLAMYQAKKAGRNAVRFFSATMQAAVVARVAMEQDLRRALQKQQFVLHYQPQIDHQGMVVGAEALLRWQHPLRGSVSPSEFIPLAEETGVILPMGQWVLEAACTQLQCWATDPLTAGLRMAVNVSARQFAESDFVACVLDVVHRFAIDARLLELEITESMVLDVVDTSAKIEALKGCGIRFSMDDFGTGYSSLSSLTRLSLHQLKIDQSFVQSMGTRPSDAIVVQTIISMAISLGLEVIAEGVETVAQRNFLLSQGCKLFQGYLFSRPVPLEQFEQLLHAGVQEARLTEDSRLL